MVHPPPTRVTTDALGVYVNPDGVPAVVVTPEPEEVVDNVKVVLPLVATMKYTLGLVYPEMVPEPPNVPLSVTVIPTVSVEEAQENWPAVPVICTLDKAENEFTPKFVPVIVTVV